MDRQADVDAFLHHLRQNNLLVFHGESGAGKTSLINVRIIERLWVDDYAPMLCRNWASTDSATNEATGSADKSVDSFIYQRLKESDWLAPELIGYYEDDHTLSETLDAKHGAKAVVILDQFEEVLRSDPGFARAVLDWVMNANANHLFKIVLSMRSEQLYAISDRLRDAQPFTTYFLKLRRMEGRTQAEKIIVAPNQGLREDRWHITEDAAKALADCWSGTPNGPEKHDVLGLQASLFVLYAARTDRSESITLDDVNQLKRAAQQDSLASRSQSADIFRFSLRRLMDVQMNFACEAAYSIGGTSNRVPKSLVYATQRVIANMVPYLSSGDYKVERNLPDLFKLCFARAIQKLDLRAVDAKLNDIVNHARAPQGSGQHTDYLSVTTDQLASAWNLPRIASVALPPTPSRWVETIVPVPWSSATDANPTDLEKRASSHGAGALFCFPPGRIHVELIRCFLFAIEWLESGSLVRVSGLSVALVHDGFGPALTEWSQQRELMSQWEAALALTALDGEFLSWPEITATNDPLVGISEMPPRIVCNARWINSAIKGTHFRGVVFFNCDLHATAFIDCIFEGAVFVNCRLDGAMFKECSIIGSTHKWLTSTPRSSSIDGFPSFHMEGKLEGQVVDESALSEVMDLAWYRRDTGAEDEQSSAFEGDVHAYLYSPQTGTAAVPLIHLPQDRQSRAVEPADGGLIVCGGRLSALLVNNCSFAEVPEGEYGMAMADIAGSSLDFAEQDVGSVLIRDSAVRGLSFCPSIDSLGHNPEATAPSTTQLHIDNSSLFGAFFGPGLSGQATIDNCTVLGATNCSATFRVMITNSSAGQHNVQIDKLSTPIDPKSDDSLFSGPSTRAIIYRSEPGRHEYESQMRADAATKP